MDTELNYFGDREEVDLEELIEARGEELGPEEDDDDGGHGRDDEAQEAPSRKKKDDTGKDDEVKKKREPRPKLDAVRLGGPRGLLALQAEMRDVKLKGRGHELQDLDLLLNRLQHWAHRLFPSYTFDDCLDKLEKLGTKRGVAVQVTRIRLGMTSVDDIHDTTVRGEDYVEEPENQEEQPARREDPEAEFDNMMAAARPDPIVTAAPLDQPAGMSEEQKARMLRNRMAAEERRLARLKEQREQELRAEEELAALAELDNMGDDF